MRRSKTMLLHHRKLPSWAFGPPTASISAARALLHRVDMADAFGISFPAAVFPYEPGRTEYDAAKAYFTALHAVEAEDRTSEGGTRGHQPAA